MQKVSVIKSSKDLYKDISKAVSLVNFKINKGDVVLLKPNYVYDAPNPATTAPDFLKACVELFKKHGASRVIIGESSVYWQNTKKVMKNQGAYKVAEETGAEIHIFDDNEWKKVDIKDAKYKKAQRMPKILDEVDKLIFLPCLKTHSLARFTMSLKLAIGCSHKLERLGHFVNLEPKVAEIASTVHPDLCILDGRKCFVTGGPGKGDVETPNLILASKERIALDVEGIKIIQSYNADNKLKGWNPWELPTIKRAIELGLGASSEKEYKIIRK
jgi:uncharacterized protein (DUF362 family)